eukprot:scaffold2288_cov225-Chaetoceros_neogracile.AAC.1
MRCCEEAFAPRRTLRNRMEQGPLGLPPSKGVLRPSTRFALQTQGQSTRDYMRSRLCLAFELNLMRPFCVSQRGERLRWLL